ncbi:hypothetical protein M9H77_12312 [Catharanthus roseus]|uniref:Uncharacterized protein n=1 Tax=Catharanthus roseus TaxID=4058 RepID=A0ACC0BH83_CATRO|nr:hypothetical protein M9H77_12312 [Catharanthus roseus]
MAVRVWSGVSVVCLFLVPLLSARAVEEEGKENVLTLDNSNFSDTVANHNFIVVEFYAPWCGHCQRLAPEYERAASVLSSHDPPIILAKIDGSVDSNRELASNYKIQGFPTIKILRDGGKNIQDYRGPRDADGIVAYLKRQVGPASVEIKSAEDASNLIEGKKISIVGVFPEFAGQEYSNFINLAEKLRSDYDFGHTLDAKSLPRGGIVNKPTLRLFKPFDELFVDFQDFEVDSMEKFIAGSSIPIVTIFNKDPSNYEYVNKFFDNSNDKAMLFLNFTTAHDAFSTKYNDVAKLYKGKGISFLMGDVEASQNAFQYFGLKEDQVPLIIIQNTVGTKYLKSNVAPDQIEQWLKDYKDGKVLPFIRSEPIPEVNNEPVKVVVTNSLEDMVFKSGKNVLLEFYAPWCGHCQKLAPILEEVATSFEDDHDVMIAKLDATANDVPNETFDVQGFPTLYFRSASGNLLQYGGDRTKEDIISFIEKNRDKPEQKDSRSEESIKLDLTTPDSGKDEL